ncbi:GNAT family N-acetyltransferase [Halobacillus salinarum]|uniref:GNAT family N-acetyltransferase n=1 Tax=Halobacillus salinarum TaxID=2932257 RepID=A0ABY4EPP1_9BACI|nr:GNAT family N-acetyltransferase [Halobacillus salinarum]UOQ45882.1 GNAT family N-acetyltransferase [Halobacillus salinarum]
MESLHLQVRKLTDKDLPAFSKMDTGIEDDYVLRIFDRLIASQDHTLFGLFNRNQLVSVGGYSLFANGRFAMIGRMRTDRRFYGKGCSTQLLLFVVEELHTRNEILWMGANTHKHNKPARRVLEKIGLLPGPLHYYTVLRHPQLLAGSTKGKIWGEVTEIKEKRTLLLQLEENTLGFFPYECYYPFPYHKQLFTDKHLSESSVYTSPDGKRFVIIRNDRKGEEYSHVKYFWNDHYLQPGLFETILHHWRKHPSHTGCWIDFSPEGYHNIPDLTPFEIQKPWILYGKWMQS